MLLGNLKQGRIMKKIKIKLILLFCLFFMNSHSLAISENELATQQLVYKKVTNNQQIYKALDLLKETTGSFSRNAILGDNLTQRPVKIEFKELSSIKPEYANYDALGMKKGKQLYIYINQKHYNAPPEAIAALLSHEALHQDEYNSIKEETYAWTMEATVWAQLCKQNPNLKEEKMSSLALRENMLLKMLENANYSNVLIKNTVVTHPGYQKLPQKSPGFD